MMGPEVVPHEDTEAAEMLRSLYEAADQDEEMVFMQSFIRHAPQDRGRIQMKEYIASKRESANPKNLLIQARLNEYDNVYSNSSSTPPGQFEESMRRMYLGPLSHTNHVANFASGISDAPTLGRVLARFEYKGVDRFVPLVERGIALRIQYAYVLKARRMYYLEGRKRDGINLIIQALYINWKDKRTREELTELYGHGIQEGVVPNWSERDYAILVDPDVYPAWIMNGIP